MAIALVAGSNVSSAFDANGATLAVNVGTGANRLLVVVITTDDATVDINTLTYAGVALTEAVDFTDTDQEPERVWLYYLVNPAQNTNNLVIDFAGTGSGDRGMMASAFT